MNRTLSRVMWLGLFTSLLCTVGFAQQPGTPVLFSSEQSNGGIIIQNEGSVTLFIGNFGQPSPIFDQYISEDKKDTVSIGLLYTFEATFKAEAYPTIINLNSTVNFPSRDKASDYDPKEYQMIGLPGASDLPVNTFFSGEQDKNWQVYRDNGNPSADPSQYLVAFNSADPLFKFTAGRAFWIITKGNLQINRQGIPSVPLNAKRQAVIVLQPGWNQITNPFPVNIQWAEVKTASNTDKPIYAYNSGYSLPDTLEPYKGYYFDNTGGPDTLKIPYSTVSLPASIADPIIWRVRITLSSGTFVENITSFGIAPEASTTLDRFDFRKPRAIAATPIVEFKRPQWDANYSAFATDIRPEFEESQSWEFDVRTPQRDAAQLTFTGISKIPGDFEVYLIDAGRARTVNLRKDSLYRFTPAAELSKFSVVVGKKETVQEQLNSMALPKDFSLGPSYPNPFSANGTFSNPTTTIPVAIPVTSEVKLKIYNLLGAEVKTIYDGSIEAGRYWFNWDGRNRLGENVATGVYLFRLSTSTGVSLPGKMILMR